MSIKKIKAFSARETLVTGVIVAIVGVTVIFMMYQNAQVREAVTQIDKTFVALNNAFNLAKMNEGTPEAWYNGGEDPDKLYYKVFAKYLSMAPAELPANFAGQIYYGIQGNTEEYVSKNNLTLGRLNDGILLRFANTNPYCNTVRGQSNTLKSICGEIYVQIKDINGNVSFTNSILGKNTFVFYVTKDGILPVGIKDSQDDAQFLCNPSSDVKVSSKTCTAWAVRRRNLDYLKNSVEW